MAGAQNLDFRGQLSGLHVSGIKKPYSNINGLRYIPELKFDVDSLAGLEFESEASANLNSYLEFIGPDSVGTGYKIKPYRVWAGLSGDQSELRIGLQKINFGSAMMLRPLMWFDKMDPRDPLQLTDGVYSALFRYYFLNNANIWIWGLIGNDRVKGWEQFSTTSWVPEFGARLQVPAGTGELALTGHFRQVDPSKPALDFIEPVSESKIPEYRLGFDGKWDLGVGLWFETSIEMADYESVFPGLDAGFFSRKTTLGADYTFGIGSGLTVVAEQFNYSASDKLFEQGEGLDFTALSLNYPLTMFHTISAMVYYDWTNKSWYRFMNLQMVYDRWSFYIIGFWNPEQFQIYQNLDEPNVFAGKGVQLMFVYNH
jgi:hypothetical protein